MQARGWFAFGDAEDHYKYRAVVMQAYPAGRFPVFAGYNYTQYQIRDPRGFAAMLDSIIQYDTMPDLPKNRKICKRRLHFAARRGTMTAGE